MTSSRLVLPLAALALSACVAVPPPQPPAAPLVAYPGAGKTAEVLQADDAACQAGLASLPPPGTAASGNAAPAPNPPPAATSPAEAYLQCMAARGNVVAPAYVPPALTYAPVYPSYFYGAYGWGYPYPYPLFGYGYGYHRFYGGYRGFYGRPFGARGGFRGGPFNGGRGGFGHRGRH